MIKSYLQSMLVSLQFLTQIPVKFKRYPDEKIIGTSLVFYPLVGILIGSLLSLVATLSADVPHFFSAAIILLVWIAITGALHLDGLADTCDAYLGGIGDKQRTLDIMKDPCSGPIAVVVLVSILLIKFSAIVSLLEIQAFSLLILAPLASRALLPIFLICTPYVRENGIGAVMVRNSPKIFVILSGTLGLLVTLWLSSLWLIIVSLLTVFIIRYLSMKRLQGLTGDIAGACVEIVETMVLVSLVYSLY